MQSYSILFLVFIAVCLVVVSGNNKTATGNEGIQILSPAADGNSPPEPRPALVPVESEEDKKLLLPVLVMKPLATIAGGLLTGGKLNQKSPSIPKPATSVPTENNVLVVIDSNDQEEKREDDEPRKFLLPILAIKPLIIVSALTGTKLLKLPAMTVPKIGITITKHEYPSKSADSTAS